jgi:hypothetical protein
MMRFITVVLKEAAWALYVLGGLLLVYIYLFM